MVYFKRASNSAIRIDAMTIKTGPRGPQGFPGMESAEVQAIADANDAALAQLTADAAASADAATLARDDADAAVTLAQQAQAASLEVPDNNVSALIGNPATDTRSALNATFASSSVVRSLTPTPLTDVTVEAVPLDVGVVTDYLDGVAWGGGSGFFRYSTDEGVTWEQGPALPTGEDSPQRMLPTADGEIIVVFPAAIYKSTGWTGIGSSPTWATKVTANGLAAFTTFGTDGNGTKFIAAEYGPGSGQAWIDSRYAHISLDAGETWTAAYDSDVVTSNAPADSHVHGACYDPWNDTFYVSEGHSTSAGLWHSTDDGATWTLAPGMATNPTTSHSGMTAGPTVIVATDDGLCCGADHMIGGLYGVPRTANPMDQELVQTWFWRPGRSGVNGFGERGFRDPATGLVYIGFDTSGPKPIIAAGTATTGGLVWEWSAWAGTAADEISNLFITDNGTLIARGLENLDRFIIRGKVGAPGASSPIDRGGLYGGAALDPSSTAIGYDATAGTQIRSVAVGVESNVFGDGVAIGYQATTTATRSLAFGMGASAAGTAVAIGADVTATASSVIIGADAAASAGNNAVAVGRQASAGTNAVAVGHSSSSVTEGTAVGQGAVAGTLRSVAFGYGANASHTDSVAIGANATTSATDQFAVGTRHIEVQPVEHQAAPATGARIYVFTDGTTGKSTLHVRFATGALQTIATEP